MRDDERERVVMTLDGLALRTRRADSIMGTLLNARHGLSKRCDGAACVKVLRDDRSAAQWYWCGYWQSECVHIDHGDFTICEVEKVRRVASPERHTSEGEVK